MSRTPSHRDSPPLQRLRKKVTATTEFRWWSVESCEQIPILCLADIRGPKLQERAGSIMHMFLTPAPPCEFLIWTQCEVTSLECISCRYCADRRVEAGTQASCMHTGGYITLRVVTSATARSTRLYSRRAMCSGLVVGALGEPM